MLHTTPSGLLIIDKPQGVTSFDAVAAVRGALHIKKVGHAGTLDPMATGTLVIAFGHATRLLNAIVAHDKTYEATIRLGLRTTTDDAEGEVLVDDEARSRWQTLSAQLTEGGQSGEPTALPTASWQDLLTRTIATNFTGDIEKSPIRSPPSKSTASVPTTWLAKARMWNSNPARSPSANSPCWISAADS